MLTIPMVLVWFVINTYVFGWLAEYVVDKLVR